MAMDEKTKELIMVGASITANCQPCLKYHTDKALESGAEPQEVAEAVEMGKRVRKGASAKMDGFASETVAGIGAVGEKKSSCCG
jgi:AhpD family alkylhydroperoxidase